MSNKFRSVLFRTDPFPEKPECYYMDIPELPNSWITCHEAAYGTPSVMAFRLDYISEGKTTFVAHVSADQQYLLYLDGIFVGRGCDMKSPEDWFFESYEISVDKGSHQLEALVWNFGNLSPANRMSIAPGFILIPDPPHTALLGTGVAPWKTRMVPGVEFEEIQRNLGVYISVPPCEVRDCSRFYHEDSLCWSDPVILGPGVNGSKRKSTTVHCLVPTPIERLHFKESLPGKAIFIASSRDSTGYVPIEESPSADLIIFNSALNTEPVIVVPLAELRVIFRLNTYYCGYTKLAVKGGLGARIRITWAEACFTDSHKSTKSDRHSISGKYFRGVWDEFLLDGAERELTPLAWRSGTLIEVHIVAANHAVNLESLTILETRYPLEPEGAFHCDQKSVNAIVPLCIRTLQSTAHDNFVDCPYYEQLPYTGDGRLQALVNLFSCYDDTLVKKMLVIFAHSRDLSGLTMSAWPRTLRCIIPSFSLSWIGMVYDYALWRNDRDLVVSLLPAVRSMLDHFIAKMDSDGFLQGVATEWNFIDWVDEWSKQEGFDVSPGIEGGGNATYNWLFVYILGLATKLEEYAGDYFLAARWEKIAAELSHKLLARFWDPDRGVFKDDDSGDFFSQHTQIMAILSGRLPGEYLNLMQYSLFEDKGLSTCSIFYKHYLFEACRELNLPDRLLNELTLWNSFISEGLQTAPETPVNRTFNQRSDCHGWGAHPFYHLVTNLAGIQPAEMGFAKALISPRMGNLKEIAATCMHPNGKISVKLSKQSGEIKCSISLPPAICGEFRYGNKIIMLNPGEQFFSIEEKRPPLPEWQEDLSSTSRMAVPG